MSATEANDRDDIGSLHREAQVVCGVATRDGEVNADHLSDGRTPTKKADARNATDAARAVLWKGIVGAAKHLGKREPLQVAHHRPVVQLKDGAATIAVYFIGAGLFEFHVAQLLPSQHPVFAVEIMLPAQWHDAALNGDIEASPTLQQMVEPYVAALHAHAGSRPCVLVGYSFHANMAFEAAHQLQARGGKVELLMLLDAPAQYPPAHRAAWQKLREVWSRRRHADVEMTARAPVTGRLAQTRSILTWAFFEYGKLVKGYLRRRVLGDPGKLTTKLDTLGRPLHWPMVECIYANSLRRYELRPLDCRAVVFRADRQEDCPGGIVDYSLGWSNLFRRGIEVIQVSGDHITMMRERPHDQNLARRMGKVLDALDALTPEGAPHSAPSAGG